MTRLFWGLVLCFCASDALGQDVPKLFTVAQALEFASKHSPLVMAAKAGTEALEAKLREADFAAWPHASFKALFAPMARQYGDAVRGGTDLGEWGIFAYTEVVGTLPIYTFGKVGYLKEAARWGVDVGKAREAIAVAEVAFRVKRGFEGLALAIELAEVIKEGKEYLEKARKHLEELEASDDPSYDPVDRMKLRVYETDVLDRELRVQRQAQLAKALLRMTLGIEPTKPVEFAITAPRPIAPAELSLEEAVRLALEKRPELVAMRHGIKGREAEVAARRAAFFPNVFLLGQFKYGYSNVADPQASPFANDPFNTYTAGGGLGIEMDLEFGQKSALLRQAEAELAKMQEELREAENAVRVEVERLFLEMRDAKRLVAEYEEAVSAARGWVIAKTDLYENDLCGINEVLDGLVQFFRVRLEALQAIHDYNVAVASLERAVGTELVERR